jgi:hypothetical protein
MNMLMNQVYHTCNWSYGWNYVQGSNHSHQMQKTLFVNCGNLDPIELQKWNWSQGYEMDEIVDMHEPYDMNGFVHHTQNFM